MNALTDLLNASLRSLLQATVTAHPHMEHMELLEVGEDFLASGPQLTEAEWEAAAAALESVVLDVCQMGRAS